jgi:hypothetical protein
MLTSSRTRDREGVDLDQYGPTKPTTARLRIFETDRDFRRAVAEWIAALAG